MVVADLSCSCVPSDRAASTQFPTQASEDEQAQHCCRQYAAWTWGDDKSDKKPATKADVLKLRTEIRDIKTDLGRVVEGLEKGLGIDLKSAGLKAAQHVESETESSSD